MRLSKTITILTLPTIFILLSGYIVASFIILITGGIHSAYLFILYFLMVNGLLGSRYIGYTTILFNVISLIFIYTFTDHFFNSHTFLFQIFPTRVQALFFHLCLTAMTGLLIGFTLEILSAISSKRRRKQLAEIQLLNKMVHDQTKEIQSMKEHFMSYFHHETGNLVAAISQQASVLKIMLKKEHKLLPVVENISMNCEQLYSTSKDFIWSINHNSRKPLELFLHLAADGQHYFNQHDIEFSPNPPNKRNCERLRITPDAAKNLIAIFREAMSNVVKHSGAGSVSLDMYVHNGYVRIALQDNGTWKKQPIERNGNGLMNMESRCKRNEFGLHIHYGTEGTCVEVTVPVSIITSPIANTKSNFKDTVIYHPLL